MLTIVGFASVVDGVGLGDGTVRAIAIVVLAVFGVVVAVPSLADRAGRPLAAFSRLGPRSAGDGFLSGLAVGGALGFVYAPCAGPILAGVISVSSVQGASGDVIVVAGAYALGSGVTLLALALLGRGALDRVRRAGRGPALQRALGGLMVATALVMALELDIRFQTAIADDLPGFVVNPTRSLERSDAVESRLRDLRGRPRFAGPDGAAKEPGAPDLPVLGTAPEFAAGRWFNSRPLTIEGLRGRVVLIDFWTYTCINCIRTMPFVRMLDERYRAAGLTDRRRPHARVHVRARRRQRQALDRRQRPALPGRPGQRVRAPGARGATSTGRPST